MTQQGGTHAATAGETINMAIAVLWHCAACEGAHPSTATGMLEFSTLNELVLTALAAQVLMVSSAVCDRPAAICVGMKPVASPATSVHCLLVAATSSVRRALSMLLISSASAVSMVRAHSAICKQTNHRAAGMQQDTTGKHVAQMEAN